MPHIAFDLDAIAKVSTVARSAGVQEGAVAWGLVQLWEWCWREKRSAVSTIHLRGFFGCNAEEALVAFGFLEKEPEGYRVRGAEKYLRIRAGHAAGGRASKQNLMPGGRCEESKASTLHEVSTPHVKGAECEPGVIRGGAERDPDVSREGAESRPRLDLGSTASSEQRTANSEQRKEEEALPVSVQSAQTPPPAVASVSPPVPPVERRAVPRVHHDPDVQPLGERMEAVWQERHGSLFAWSAPEERAVAAALGKAGGDEEAVLLRWRNAVFRDTYPLCCGVADLVRHWNAYGGKLPTRAAKGRATEADKDWSKPQPVVQTEWGEELAPMGGGS